MSDRYTHQMISSQREDIPETQSEAFYFLGYAHDHSRTINHAVSTDEFNSRNEAAAILNRLRSELLGTMHSRRVA